jgi:hypothetical protein
MHVFSEKITVLGSLITHYICLAYASSPPHIKKSVVRSLCEKFKMTEPEEVKMHTLMMCELNQHARSNSLLERKMIINHRRRAR